MCNPCFQGVEPADTNCRPAHKQIQAQTLIRYIELSIKEPGRRQPTQTSRVLMWLSNGSLHCAQLSVTLTRAPLLTPTFSQGVSFSSLALRCHSVRKKQFINFHPKVVL